MSGVDFGSLPPGARSQWLNEGDRRNHDALYTGDITGAKPGLLSVFVSNRGHNDPLEPKYGLPSVPAPTNPNLHSRTQMPLGSAHARHEPTDINAKRVSAFSCMSETPARDIMRTHDIIGGGRRQTRAVQKGYDSMQVQDINHDGVFKSTRRGANPLEPTYTYDPVTHQEWAIPNNKPRGFRNLSDNPDLKLKTRDILGCCPDDLTKVTRTVNTRQVMRTDDIDAAQANTVMHAMRTTRCTNPLDPVYVPLQSTCDIAPAFPNLRAPGQLPPSIRSHRSQPMTPAAAPKTPGTIQREAVKRTKELTAMMQERLDQKGGQMRHQFVKFDANHDGTINHEEFRNGLLEGLGMPIKTPDVNLLINQVDRDNSGRIDYIEFAEKMKQADETSYMSLGEKSGAQPFRIKTPGAEVNDMTEDERVDRNLDVKLHYAVQQKCANIISEFRKFDEDGDSMLSRSELKRGLERVGVQFSDYEFKRLVLRMDKDDTGFVDYSEFMRHMEAPEAMQKGADQGSLIHNKAFHEAQKEKVPHMLSGAEKRDRDLIMAIREKADQRSSNARKLMAKFDNDGSGQLDYPEFRRGLEQGLNMPMKDEEFSRIVTLFDPDHSGQIDYLEFSECIKGKEFGREEIYFKKPKKEEPGPSKPSSSGGRLSGRSGRASGQSTPKATRLARAKDREDRQREIDSIANLPDDLPQGNLNLSKVVG